MKPNIYQNRRNHNRNRNNNNNHNRVNILRQTLDSHGPSVRIRGNPSQICEKYLSMARDALSSGDPILAENLQQHADHYQRLINSAQQQNNERQERNNERRNNNNSNRNNRQDTQDASQNDNALENDEPAATEATAESIIVNSSADQSDNTSQDDDKIVAGQISFLSAGVSENTNADAEPVKVKKSRAKKASVKKTRARKLDTKIDTTLDDKVNTANSLA